MIEFKAVFKSFGSFHVLKNFSFVVPKGKISVLIGRSGSGKSVLLKHVLGFLEQDKGEIFIHGKNTKNFTNRDWVEFKKNTGMLFQDSALFDSMTVWQNVAFPLQEHTKKTPQEIDEVVKQKLRVVGLVGQTEKIYQ